MANRRRLVSILQSVEQVGDQTRNNTFSISSNSTAAMYIETGTLKGVTLRDGKEMIEDIVDGIFDANIGVANLSSSQPSLTDTFESSEEMDERLKRWQDMLRDRLKMQERIWRKTGKSPNEMLFNLPPSVEQREKGTVHRLMDYASRMNPIRLKQKIPDVLPQRLDRQTGTCLLEVQETLPQAERTGTTSVEISGLPKSTKREILSPPRGLAVTSPKQNKNKWYNSKELENQILAKDEDIRRVLEFCPDISGLEVVGNNHNKFYHTEHIDLLHSEHIYTVSTSTESYHESQKSSEVDCHQQLPPEDIKVGIKINDMVYTAEQKRHISVGDLQFHFECEPYQVQVKEVFRLENIGKKVMICEWTRHFETHQRTQDWEDCENCFLFDRKLLILFPGEVYISKVLFQPSVVSLSKQSWELKTFPNIFCTPRGALVVYFIGKCVVPLMYAEKINRLLQFVIDKSTDQAIRKLSTNQGELAPLLESAERLLPCGRDLDERELFNALNVGYHCKRFEDLEDLRVLHNALKTPREPIWDLRLDTIKKIILRLPILEYRESYFNKFIDIQQSMKSCGDTQFSTFDHRQERERSRLIYVRGCIANGIEEWEELMISIELTCLKSEYVNFYSDSQDKPGEGEDEKPWLTQLKNDNLDLYLLKKLRAKKYYRDSLYIQTYTLMCDIAENIVSIIESTEFI
ncbi:uncharacterized protein LOC117785552 [Drosophila innubila]|uniref:uncharacterized protein LOC117785552 n=1 Tax=Drosophila innubila TaxID=198719 RepID=UPI00148B99DD|nr:uncharacterized protein LOC117785552 [Drosophila innubila]